MLHPQVDWGAVTYADFTEAYDFKKKYICNSSYYTNHLPTAPPTALPTGTTTTLNFCQLVHIAYQFLCQYFYHPHHQPHNKTQLSRWCPEGLLPSSTHTTMATNIWSTKNHGSTLPYIIINAAANYFYHSYHIHRRILSWGTSLFHYFPPPSLTSTSVALTLHMKQRCDRPLLPNR